MPALHAVDMIWLKKNSIWELKHLNQINVQQIFAGMVVNFLPVEDQTVDMFSFSIVAFTSFSSSKDSGAGL